MKVIWNSAITLDGNIAKVDGNSDWPIEADSKLFNQQVQKSGAVIIGRNTFEQYKGEVFPIEGATTFVWTQNIQSCELHYGVEYVSGTVNNIVELLERSGYTECVLAGGSITNNAFVSAGLIDEIIVTIYPLLFGHGMRFLSVENCDIKLKLLESKNIGEGVIRNIYKVLR